MREKRPYPLHRYARRGTAWIVATLFLFVTGCCADYFLLPEGDSYGMIGDSIFAVGTGECADVGVMLNLSRGERMTNMAASGAQIERILARYHRLVEMEPSMQVVIADGGTNDVVAKRPVREIYEDIVRLFETVLADGNDLIYVLPYHYRGERASYNPVIDELDTSLLVACDEMDIECIDLRDIFDAYPEFYLDDIHPTFIGRAVITAQIRERIDEGGSYEWGAASTVGAGSGLGSEGPICMIGFLVPFGAVIFWKRLRPSSARPPWRRC